MMSVIDNFMLSSEHLNDGKYCCNICKKNYTKKSSLDKHKILCDFKHKTEREREIEVEESSDIPNHYELVKIVQELMLKNIRLEEKMNEMQKWVDKKKKKINVISWLNTNINPTIGFKEWVATSIEVNEEHVKYLMDNSLYQTVEKVFEDNLPEYNENNEDLIYPIKCFNQKSGIFYIADKLEDGKSSWRLMTNADFSNILVMINSKMLLGLTKWKHSNKANIDDNDKLCEQFNKAIIKWMNISFSQDPTFNRIKNGLYNYLKKDLKSMLIEYDFEF
jgi:hypothetical protein